jgi:metallopeptidase MepB
MNYPKPTHDKPTFLGMDDIRKLFHELGHVLHSLFTRVKYASLHQVDRDFVEAPSMMLEQFFWKECHIRQLSFHYSHISQKMKEIWRASLKPEKRDSGDEKPARLSDEVVATLARSNKRKNVQGQVKELFFASYDMLVHSQGSRETLKGMNLTETFNRLRPEVYKVNGGEAIGEGWEWSHGEAVFRNIINGYDAGYYGYIL